MRVSRTLETIWQIKETIGRELEGKSDEEILAYYQSHEPEWSKSIPRFGSASSTSQKPELPSAWLPPSQEL